VSGEQSFCVPDEDARRRLDEFLFDRVPALSRGQIRAGIRDGAVQVNGAVAHSGWKLQAGDAVVSSLDRTRPSSMRAEPMELRILRETAGWAAVDKPAGMLVHPTLKVKSGTLLNGLAARWAVDGLRLGLANRLDQPTSGIVIVAKTPQAGRALGKAMAGGAFEKRYRAIVDGVVEANELTIDAPIARIGYAAPHWGIRPEGKASRSRLWVVERGPAHTLVDLEPVTGRTNQLRVHCAHSGHPILGDEVYGGGPAARLFLHAMRLGFPDPDSGEFITIESPPPPVFDSAWDMMMAAC
jgi:23S rRNA pseudouridine1911/1915/1917 synthase